jgi:hypothetical protein
VFVYVIERHLCTHGHLVRCFMPGSTGSTGKQPVVPVDINPVGASALVLRVFVLAVVLVAYR